MCPVVQGRDLPRFSRDFFGSGDSFTSIGSEAIGGKASGLLLVRDLLTDRGTDDGIEVSIPTLTVVCTDQFDAFLDRNDLRDRVRSEESDRRIAAAFLQADLPVELLGDLRGLVERVHTPLAVRSSSMLEDALYEPFAGVYATKMIPNNQPSADTRFQKLVEAIKLVWASTYFRAARSYLRATTRAAREEKMAVLIQEVVGRRHDGRFYPELSGVARSYNFYPQKGTRPEDGVVSLALGLGKTIVDGGRCWSYSPSRPKVPPPFASARELLRETQTEFWAVNMGDPPEFDPLTETEYLVRAGLAEAEYDGALRHLASTYDPHGDRLSPGTGIEGSRALTFAPLLVLEEIPLNRTLRELLEMSRAALGAPVEIEFAATLPGGRAEPARLGFLQVRAMAVSDALIEIDPAELGGAGVVLASDTAMGNGIEEGIRDVVYVVPDRFEARHTPAIARELAELNRRLVDAERPYLLIGFGRWGSSDPWLGIPVEWGDISGARAMVEATLPEMNVELSQGSHFFHNLSSFGVCYFQVPFDRDPGIAWGWLAAQPVRGETDHVRHVELASPLRIKVDGRTGLGVVLRAT